MPEPALKDSPASPSAALTDEPVAPSHAETLSPAEGKAKLALFIAVGAMVIALPMGLLAGLFVTMVAPKPGEPMGALFILLGVDGFWLATGLAVAVVAFFPGAFAAWRAFRDTEKGDRRGAKRATLAIAISAFAGITALSSVGLVGMLDYFFSPMGQVPASFDDVRGGLQGAVEVTVDDDECLRVTWRSPEDKQGVRQGVHDALIGNGYEVESVDGKSAYINGPTQFTVRWSTLRHGDEQATVCRSSAAP